MPTRKECNKTMVGVSNDSFLVFTAPNTWKRVDPPPVDMLDPFNGPYAMKPLGCLYFFSVRHPEGLYQYAMAVPPLPMQWVWFPTLEDLQALWRLWGQMDLQEFRACLEGH